MSIAKKKLEQVSNILIITVALIIIFLFIQKYFFSTPVPQGKIPTIGATVPLESFDWSKSEKNILIVMQEGCHFCEESTEFYRKLIAQSQGKNVKIVAVFPPENKDVEKYLSNFGITEIDTKTAQFSSLDVDGTPTIIVANDKGTITNAWRGKLTSSKESEVMALLN